MALGGGNPFPFKLGGGTSDVERVYNAMFQSVGIGNRATTGTIIEAWRHARARGIQATAQDERAMFQAFPDFSTDFLPVWEEILDIIPPSEATDDQRRVTVLERYTRTIDATFPKLTEQLQLINPNLEIFDVDQDLKLEMETGVRAFQDYDPNAVDASGPAYDLPTGASGPNQTSFPNFSNDFILNVLLNTAVGPLTVPDQRTIVEVKEELNESLPSWVDFRVFTACGFVLDQDLLDVTVFCE